jgi:E3 ubiquitin-protein ligase SHPRH
VVLKGLKATRRYRILIFTLKYALRLTVL